MRNFNWISINAIFNDFFTYKEVAELAFTKMIIRLIFKKPAFCLNSSENFC